MAVDMVAGAVKKILDAVVGGTFVEEEPLPAEAELARFLNVSRPTMREAVRTLALGGVLNVVHGRGTFLLPRFRWSELRYLMYVSAHEGNAVEVEAEVLGVEEMIEGGGGSSGGPQSHRGRSCRDAALRRALRGRGSHR